MKEERRTDEHQARVIEAAIRIDALWGCVNAWRYLLARGVLRATAVRILMKNGARRDDDPQHPAIRDALERKPESGIAQRAELQHGTGDHEVMPRTNEAATMAVNRAIELSSTHGRHYSESLLRIYSLDTATVMRVLFEPHRRRRKAQAKP